MKLLIPTQQQHDTHLFDIENFCNKMFTVNFLL